MQKKMLFTLSLLAVFLSGCGEKQMATENKNIDLSEPAINKNSDSVQLFDDNTDINIKNNSNQVIESDIGETLDNTNTNDAQYISEESAMAFALRHAGINSAEAIQSNFKMDDGRAEYEFQFYNNGIEYKYEVDALSGDVLSFEYEKQNNNISSKQEKGEISEYIGETKAQEIALSHAGLTDSEVTRLKIELDYDDDRTIYEVEFHFNDSKVGDKEYNYEIDAYNGSILKSDIEYDIS